MTTTKSSEENPQQQLPIENANPMTVNEVSSGPLGVAKAAIGIFSTITERPPPTPTKTDHIRLITIVVSHYCEKVRWALDMLEDDSTSPYYYTEDAHPPGLHAYEPLKVTNGTASITPMVVMKNNSNNNKSPTNSNDDNDSGTTDSTTIMCESSKILQRFVPSLYPNEIKNQILDKEMEFGRRLGPAARCFAYHELLSDKDFKYAPALHTMCADPNLTSSIESTFFKAFLPRGLGAGIKKGLGITTSKSMASIDEIRSVFKETSDHLETTGGEYLMDNPKTKKLYGFTAADMTFCALAYPFIRPSEMSPFLADETLLPDSINSLSKELRDTTAGKYVLNIYQKHRPIDSEKKHVVMKTVDRNRTFFGWLFGY